MGVAGQAVGVAFVAAGCAAFRPAGSPSPVLSDTVTPVTSSAGRPEVASDEAEAIALEAGGGGRVLEVDAVETDDIEADDIETPDAEDVEVGDDAGETDDVDGRDDAAHADEDTGAWKVTLVTTQGTRREVTVDMTDGTVVGNELDD
jgi:hypothetical protein